MPAEGVQTTHPHRFLHFVKIAPLLHITHASCDVITIYNFSSLYRVDLHSLLSHYSSAAYSARSPGFCDSREFSFFEAISITSRPVNDSEGDVDNISHFRTPVTGRRGTGGSKVHHPDPTVHKRLGWVLVRLHFTRVAKPTDSISWTRSNSRGKLLGRFYSLRWVLHLD